MKNAIKFYNTDKPFGEFSNFSRHSVIIDGEKWNTTEHYFQAMKFIDNDIKEKIRNAKTAFEAAKLGRSKKYPLRKDWENTKIDIMLKALRSKFTQHEELKTLLLSTEDFDIIEHTNNDDYWGDGGDGSGKNILGKLLMQVRKELESS